MTAPTEPTLGGPYGEGTTDPADKVALKASIAWVLTAVQALKGYAQGILTHAQDLVTVEAQDRADAVTAEAQDRAAAVTAEAQDRAAAIAAEVVARNAAIATATSGLASTTSLGGYATTGALDTEVTNRTNADADLQTQIDTLKSRIDAAAIP
jgi:hypothetical protein